MSEGKPLVEDGNTTLDKIIKYFPRFAIPIGILMLLAYFGNFNDGFGNQSDFGAFGDFFGGILNPLLTFFTILLLLRQLTYQRDELKATRDELIKTTEIHKENVKNNLAEVVYSKTEGRFQTLNKELEEFVNQTVYSMDVGTVEERRVTFEELMMLVGRKKEFVEAMVEANQLPIDLLQMQKGYLHLTAELNELIGSYFKYEVPVVLYKRSFEVSKKRTECLLVLSKISGSENDEMSRYEEILIRLCKSNSIIEKVLSVES